MAWPCITRACCINRFWSDLDKADIAVPLVFTKYSDVAEVRHLHPQPGPIAQSPHHHHHLLHQPRAVAIETEPAHSALDEPTDAATSAPIASSARGSSVTRQDFRAWRVRPEPSCKPKHEYRPSETPFDTETQYRKDYKPWPIPRRDHPWIPKMETQSTKQDQLSSEPDAGVEKCEIEERVREKEDAKEERKGSVKKDEGDQAVEEKKEQKMVSRGRRTAADALNRQIKQEGTAGSSYRMEFKAYADVKPMKPFKAKSQYKLAMEDKANLETSYSATYKGEQSKPEATDNKLLERRRIRSLYNEPSIKDPSKVEKAIGSRSKAKKTTSHSKTSSKAKAKSVGGIQAAKKKTSVKSELNPDGGVTKKSKEIINRLAEAKD